MLEIEILKSENESLKKMIKNVTAERGAIDRFYLQSIKESLQLKTNCILLEELLSDKDKEIASLKIKLSEFERQKLEEVA